MFSKRQRSFLVIHAFMFLSGLEYAVIFPTLWEYLQSLGVAEDQTYWLGLCLASMTVTDMLSGLVIGRVMDRRSTRIRMLVMLLNTAQILGAGLYSLAMSQYVVMVSRLVSGLGKSITIVYLTDICRSTSIAERTPVLLVFNIAFQIGMMIGPASNFVLSMIEMSTPLGQLDRLNSPGLLMAVSWALYSLVVASLYTDLDTIQTQTRLLEEMEDEEDRQTSVQRYSTSFEGTRIRRLTSLEDNEVSRTETSPLLRYTEVNRSKDDDNFMSSDIRDIHSQDLSQYNASPRSAVKLSDVPSLTYGSVEDRDRGSPSKRVMRKNSKTSLKSNMLFGDAERMMGECSSESEQEYSEIDETENLINDIGDPGCDNDNNETSDNSDNNSSNLTTKDYVRELMREPIICLTYLRFVALFCQTSLEATVPPVMQRYFDYGDQENSILYLLAGIELILVFLVLNISSRCLSDRVLISAGLLLMLTAMTWLTATLPRFGPSQRANIPYFAVGVILDLAGIPTVCDIGLSLYSKLLPSNMQGVGHSVRRFVSQLAIILGPVWGAATLMSPYLMLLVPLVMLVIGTGLYAISFKKFSSHFF